MRTYLFILLITVAVIGSIRLVTWVAKGFVEEVRQGMVTAYPRRSP